MFELHAFFPTLSLSRKPSKKNNNAIIEQYIEAAFAFLREQLITTRITFPRNDLPQDTMAMLGKVLVNFDKMIITITKTETGQVSTFAYDGKAERLHVRTFRSSDQAWAFHCGISPEDVEKLTVETRKVC